MSSLTLSEVAARTAALQRQVDALAGKWQAADELATKEAAARPPLVEAVRVLTLSETALTALLALAAEGAFSLLDRVLIPKGLRIRAAGQDSG